MKVLIPKISTNKEWKEKILLDFASGIDKTGDHPTVVEQWTMPDLKQIHNNDIGVYYGSLKQDRLHRDLRQQVKQLMQHFYSDCVVIETPLIDRKKINNEFRVGMNGNLRNNAKWSWGGIDQNRVKKFYKNRSFTPQSSWKQNRGDTILLIMQNHDDMLTQGLDVFEWTMQTILEIKKYTDRSIVVRSNPFHSKQETEMIIEFEKQILSMPGVDFSYADRRARAKPIQQDLNSAWCVVCHSSGVAVDATISGIPVISLSESSMAWDVSGHDLSQIEHPITPDPVPWFEKIAMIQYSQEEFRSGECWNYVKPLCS